MADWVAWRDVLVREVPTLLPPCLDLIVDYTVFSVQSLCIGSKVDCLNLGLCPPRFLTATVIDLHNTRPSSSGIAPRRGGGDHDTHKTDDSGGDTTRHDGPLMACRRPIRWIQVRYDGWLHPLWNEWIELSDPSSSQQRLQPPSLLTRLLGYISWTCCTSSTTTNTTSLTSTVSGGSSSMASTRKSLSMSSYRITEAYTHPETRILCHPGDRIRLNYLYNGCSGIILYSVVAKVVRSEPVGLIQRLDLEDEEPLATGELLPSCPSTATNQRVIYHRKDTWNYPTRMKYEFYVNKGPRAGYSMMGVFRKIESHESPTTDPRFEPAMSYQPWLPPCYG